MTILLQRIQACTTNCWGLWNWTIDKSEFVFGSKAIDIAQLQVLYLYLKADETRIKPGWSQVEQTVFVLQNQTRPRGGESIQNRSIWRLPHCKIIDGTRFNSMIPYWRRIEQSKQKHPSYWTGIENCSNVQLCCSNIFISSKINKWKCDLWTGVVLLLKYWFKFKGYVIQFRFRTHSNTKDEV